MTLTFLGQSILRKTIHPVHSSIFPHLPPDPRFGTVGFWGQGPGDIKTSRSKGENQQQTQRLHIVTSGGIRTRGTLIGAAPHISFPIEKKKNFSFYPRFIFYRLLNQFFLFSTCSPCKQTNRNLRMWIFFLPLVMHGSQWYLGRVSTATRKLKQLT